jgi:bile acid:Na+ symporter, BASS family
VNALAAQIMDVAGRYLLPASLWAVMLAMGMGLSVADFRGILSNRRAFVVGVGSMLVLVPASGIALGTAFAPTPVLAVGLILLATTPSGILSNLLTDIAGGEVALSISISLLLSVVYVFTLPFIAHFALQYTLGEAQSIAIPLGDSMGHILTITLIPVLLGMSLRAFRARLAAAAAPIIKRAATTLLVVLFGMIIVQQIDTLRSAFGPLLAIVLAMNVVNAVIAQIVASLAKVRHAERIAISVEHLIRQEATAIYVAVSLLHRNDMSLPMILNTFVGMALCVTFVSMMRRRRALSRLPGSHQA